MKKNGLRTGFAFALAAVAWPAPILAQETAPQRTPPTGWQVDWGDNYCTLIRRSGGDRTPSFAIRRVPGSGATQLVTLDPGTRPRQSTSRQEVEIVFSPAGQRVEAVLARRFRADDGRAGSEIGAQDPLLDALAGSTSLAVTDGSGTIFQMTYPLAREAVDAMRACEADALRQWGLDPAVFATQRTAPRLIDSGPRSYDYPVTALRQHQEGTVVVRLTVGIDGRISDCAPIVSSGVPALDRESCTSFQRARFAPALNEDGQPIQGIYVSRIQWRIPR